MSTSIVSVLMLQAWGGARAGDEAKFDEVRARYLVKNGYATADLPTKPEPEPAGAFHAARGEVYHDSPACTVGNNIEEKNRRSGTGGKPRCAVCAAS